jgi:uncharacterized protein YjbI with pentapeptide repeats
MANTEHLALVRNREDWNKWREDHPDIVPDLSGADLRWAELGYTRLDGATLSKANLSNAYLTRSNLTAADLSGADLSQAQLNGALLGKANLREVDLSRVDLGGAGLEEAVLARAYLNGANLYGAVFLDADLSEADLGEANLTFANLGGTNLRRADLHGANLRDAILDGADFSEAILGNTIFGSVDLGKAKGLEKCVFIGPCILDFGTIQRSGPLPLHFLRGCGLPDSLIESLPPLLNEAIQSCFISYSTKDKEFAERLHADLQDKGVRSWYAPDDIKPGDRIYDQIDHAIQRYDRLLLILSEASMASKWVGTEIRKAFAKEELENRRVLFPLALVPFDQVRRWERFDSDIGEDLARKVREYFIPDFSNWKDHDTYTKAFEGLLAALKAFAYETSYIPSVRIKVVDA